MPTYILLSTLTPEGRRTLHSDPDRLDEVNQEITDFGCEVIGQYAVLGSWDFVTVIQAPDNESAAHLSVALGSSRHGSVSPLNASACGDGGLPQKAEGDEANRTHACVKSVLSVCCTRLRRARRAMCFSLAAKAVY